MENMPIELARGENTEDLFLPTPDGWNRISKTGVIVKIKKEEE